MPATQSAVETRTINGRRLCLAREDVTLFDGDAFVFYAQPDLQLGSGFGTAIVSRGGGGIQKELDALGAAPVAVGRAVASGAGKLEARFIIHAVGPRFQEEDTEGKLRATIESVLQLAGEKGVKRLALPPLGAGFYGVPLELCARVMVETLAAHLAGETGLEEARICVGDAREEKPFSDRLAAVPEGGN